MLNVLGPCMECRSVGGGLGGPTAPKRGRVSFVYRGCRIAGVALVTFSGATALIGQHIYLLHIVIGSIGAVLLLLARWARLK